MELHLQVGQAVSLLESLHFIINREKSQLVAILSADPFPGFLSRLSDHKVISSQRKDPADCLDVSELSDSTDGIPQESLSTAGKDVCHNSGDYSYLLLAPLYQNLQQLKIQVLRRSLSYNNLDPPSIEELTWWSTQL